MPLATEPAQDAALDAVVSSLPSPATWRLHVDMPADTSTELAPDGGYAAVGYSAGDWAAASEGAKEATVDFGTSTDAWSDVATYWAIHDAAGVVILWDELTEPVEVSTAGTAVSVSPALFFRLDF